MSDIERVPSMAVPGEPAEADAPPPAAAAPGEPPEPPPETLRETLRRVDAGWAAFHAAAARFPSERMDEHLTEDGWTRKQMLAHIATWHDLTHDRLGKLIMSGKTATLDEATDAINARAARTAIGKTAGEIVKDNEATFNRLRRQLQRMSDDLLRRDRGWAAQVIASNTYEHYAEHMADLHLPGPPDAGGRR